jgi:hypothetical protein
MAMDWMLKRAKASIVHWATAVRKEVIQVEAVQDENDMRQISLTWRPPSNTKARVASYKVVMSIAGVALVKEIHRGTGDAFHIRGCRPGKSYQFRIKGEYSDGSYIWSDICEIYMRQPGTEVVIPKQVHVTRKGDPHERVPKLTIESLISRHSPWRILRTFLGLAHRLYTAPSDWQCVDADAAGCGGHTGM